jgi:hypothetical protein
MKAISTDQEDDVVNFHPNPCNDIIFLKDENINISINIRFKSRMLYIYINERKQNPKGKSHQIIIP